MKHFSLYIGGGIAAVLVSAVLAWFIFSSAPVTSPNTPQQGTDLGGLDNSAIATSQGSGMAGTLNGTLSVPATQQQIFKISDGPVAGATFVETARPTTTLARFVMADNGHAYDLAIDTPGATARTLSNTTIPGAQSASWAGGSALLQYLDDTTPKTVYLGLPAAGATSTLTRLMFYPDGIVSLAASPLGDAAAYLLRTKDGVAGYVSNVNGTGGKRLFTLPLSQVRLVWPAEGTLLAYSSAAAGVPGIAFAIDAKSGVVTPLVYGSGLTATADASFSNVLYQIADGSRVASFAHNVSTGADKALSFSPLPEQCAPAQGSLILCAASLVAVPSGYLDLWHQGAAAVPDALVRYNLSSGTSTLLAAPGGTDGGQLTDMASVAISPDERYALYISKNDRSLWVVRLTQ